MRRINWGISHSMCYRNKLSVSARGFVAFITTVNCITDVELNVTILLRYHSSLLTLVPEAAGLLF